MEKSRTLYQFVVLASVVILFLNARLTMEAIYNQYPTEGEAVMYNGIILTLFPASILFLALRMFRSDGERMFRIMLGMISLTYAWLFIGDPWSVQLQMKMGMPLLPLVVYTLIGTVFLLIAVLAFKKVE